MGYGSRIVVKNKIPIFMLSFLCGVLIRSFFNIPQTVVMLVLGVAVGLLFSKIMTEKIFSLPTSGLEIFSVIILIVLFFLFGALRFSVFENNITKDKLRDHYDEILTLRGSVISSESKPNSARIVLETNLGRILVINQIYPEYKYGDIMEITGKIEEPEVYGNFDVPKFLAKEEIYSQIIFPEIKKISHEPKSDLLAFLFLLKEKFETSLKNILPEPHFALADGMLLGGETVVDQSILDAFRKTSTIHILVLSGYNITIVGVFIMSFLGYFLPYAIAWFGSIFGIIAFTLMSGGEAAAVRAAVMAIIGLVALRAGRAGNAFLAFLWAAFLMILWNPMLLRFDRGFQLSFMATLGLILLASHFQKYLWFLPKFLGVKESASSSLAAQIFVLPLLIFWGNAISILSPLANIFIVSVVPLIMFFSFLGGILGFISVFLGQLPASVAYVLISYQIFMAKFLAGLDV